MNDYPRCYLPLYGRGLEYSTFAGGERHLNIEGLLPFPKGHRIVLNVNITNSEELIDMLLLNNAVQEEGFETELLILYLPYARQDRVCKRGDSFSLKVLANILNSQNFKVVSALNVHSPVAWELINNFHNISSYSYVKSLIKRNTPVWGKDRRIVLIAPDKGAFERVRIIRGILQNDKDIDRNPLLIQAISLTKKRDPMTGTVSNIIPEATRDTIRGSHCIVVDDICDGGRTFMGLGETIRKHGSKSLSLFVSHGIFSYGADEKLNKIFDGGLYTTASISGVESKQVTVL